MSHPDAHILSAVRANLGCKPPERLGVAVSGGGDSVALLHLLSRCFDRDAPDLVAATVDHGLRDGSRAEAEAVRDLAENLGIAHTILTWRGWDGTGNMQDQARRARYRLLSEWARAGDIDAVALGHTADDQAETVLMQIARSAGVDGLSAMRARKTIGGTVFVRPVLDVTRAALRAYLRRNAVAWHDDPTNDDETFQRVRARKALAALGDLGITATGLADIARYMGEARTALEWYSFLAARDLAVVEGGDIALDLRPYRTLPDETARRLLARAVAWIGSCEYPPRRAPLADLIEAVRAGRSATLGGCRVIRHQGRVWICREYKAVEAKVAAPGAVWDSRWLLNGPEPAGAEVRALGPAGLALCPDWRDTGRPMASVIAGPAVWRDARLIAAPLAGWPQGWSATLADGAESFFATLLSH